MIDLNGKVSLVTGSARGIGKEIALKLAHCGSDIILCDILEDVHSVAKDIEALGRRVLTFRIDITRIDDVEAMISESVEKLSHVDILVNNAGITRDNLIIRMSEMEWDSVIAVNLKGTFNCLKAAARVMMKQRSGRIVNVSSVVGVMGNAGQANYSASKGGVISLTKSAAKELAARNVTVNAVAPGFIETDMTKDLSDKVKETFMNFIPLKRSGTAADVANAVAFLVSDEAAYITGQVIQVDGGMLM